MSPPHRALRTPRTPWKVRFAVTATTMVGRLATGMSAVHSGFWLGMLDASSLDAATIEYYRTSDHFLDDEHNMGGLAAWEEAAIASHTSPPGHVLVPSAGGGREIIVLAEMGYDATGYDPTPELVDVGNRLIARAGSRATLLPSHGSDLPEGLDPPYDWALFGWGSLSHIHGRSNRIATLRSIHDVLAPEAVFILSFLARPPRSLRYDLVYRVARTVRDLRRSNDSLELGDTIDGSFDHFFTFEEVTTEMEAAGFTELERIEEPYAHVVCVRS